MRHQIIRRTEVDYHNTSWILLRVDFGARDADEVYVIDPADGMEAFVGYADDLDNPNIPPVIGKLGRTSDRAEVARHVRRGTR